VCQPRQHRGPTRVSGDSRQVQHTKHLHRGHHDAQDQRALHFEFCIFASGDSGACGTDDQGEVDFKSDLQLVGGVGSSVVYIFRYAIIN